MTTQRWSTRIGLILAMAGNAVGLGNFLRFPAQAAQNGGGAFMIPYLISFLVLGIPLVWVEWAIGRHGGQFGHHSTPGMFHRLGNSPVLKYFGALGLFTSLGIAAYYLYIESWALAYAWHSVLGTFAQQDPEQFLSAYLDTQGPGVVSFPKQALIFFVVTLAINTVILMRGLSGGLEKAALLLMPLLLLFGAALAIKGLFLEPGANGVIQDPLVGLNFLWEPRYDGLTNPSTWLSAAGQVFFTLSLGMGTVHCYASYVSRNSDIALNASAAGWLNEFAEVVLGGTILIPLTVAYLGLASVQDTSIGGSGFAMAFLVLPKLFTQWGAWAPVAGLLWFGLLFFAAFSSSLAMGQTVIAFLEDEFKLQRRWAALSFSVLAGLLGSACVFFYGGGSFDEFDFWTDTVTLVLFALIEIVVFTRVFGLDRGWEELTRGAELQVPRVFRPIIMYVTPTIIALVFFAAFFKPLNGDWTTEFGRLFGAGEFRLAPDSVLGKLLHLGEESRPWFENGRATRRLVEDGTRALLLATFITCCLVVRASFRKNGRNRA